MAIAANVSLETQAPFNLPRGNQNRKGRLEFDTKGIDILGKMTRRQVASPLVPNPSNNEKVANLSKGRFDVRNQENSEGDQK